jgi:superfamily II DNA helicase RecQ
MVIAYLTDVIPFHRMIKPDFPINGFLFGDEKGPWDTARQTKAFVRESTKRIGFRMTTQDYRHISIAIDRQFIRCNKALFDDEDFLDDDIHDLMAAHSSHVANVHYGRDKAMLHQLSAQSINQFRSVSDKWQRWLGLIPRLQREDFPRSPPPMSLDPKTVEEKVHKKMTDLFGNTYKWTCPEQKEAIMKINEGISPLIAVLPPAAGKTLLMQIPALIEDDNLTTVVITPLIALKDDFIQRCMDMNLDCCQWTPRYQRRARVVVVISETATSNEFAKFVLDLHLANQLSRVIFDEAHKLLTDLSYRPKLEDLKLLNLPCQLIFISGTFPPSLEQKFEDTFLLPEPEYIRCATNRPNFRYRIRIRPTKDIEDEAANFVLEKLQYIRRERKMLIFYPNVKGAERLAKGLGCAVYHARAPNKDADLEAFKEGRSCLLVATSALGAGMNIRNIGEILHIGKPYGLIDYIQESSRGGRDGEVVHATILLDEHQYRQLQQADEDTFTADELVMRELLLTDDCMRKVISRYLDGIDKETDCHKLGAEPCQNCLAQYEQSTAGRKRAAEDELLLKKSKLRKTYHERNVLIQRHIQDQADAQVYLRRQINELEAGCAACWVLGYEYHHDWVHCKRLSYVMGQSLESVKEDMKFKSGQCCYRCLRPLDWCDEWKKGKYGCKKQPVVVSVVLASYFTRDNDLKEAVKEIAGRFFPEVKSFYRWLAMENMKLGEKGTNALVLFSNLCRKWSQEEEEEEEEVDDSDSDIYG